MMPIMGQVGSYQGSWAVVLEPMPHFGGVLVSVRYPTHWLNIMIPIEELELDKQEERKKAVCLQ